VTVSTPLEDDFTDILSKAQSGWNLDDTELARQAGIQPGEWRFLKSGHPDEESLKKVAPVLRLEPGALLEIAGKRYKPAPVSAIDGLHSFSSRFHGMFVNSHMAWDPATRAAAAFDTGAEASPMLEFARRHGLEIQSIFLTHTHADHIADLEALRKKTGARVWVSEREPLQNAETFSPGEVFELGGLRVETRSTFGHSPGGTTYVIRGLQLPVAIVGDALFAGSMGGGRFSFRDALETNRSGIFTLPGETILCPGHGPNTTVDEQKHSNPFFAD